VPCSLMFRYPAIPALARCSAPCPREPGAFERVAGPVAAPWHSPASAGARRPNGAELLGQVGGAGKEPGAQCPTAFPLVAA